jgi:hypothetical protein
MPEIWLTTTPRAGFSPTLPGYYLDRESGIRIDFTFSYSLYARQAIERAKEEPQLTEKDQRTMGLRGPGVCPFQRLLIRVTMTDAIHVDNAGCLHLLQRVMFAET